MRRRLSVDFSCLNSFHNCLCCVLGKAGVQSKYFLAEKGSGMAKEKSLCYLDFKHFFYILQRMAEGRGCFNQVKRATLLLRKTCLCFIPASVEDTKGKGRFRRREIKRLVVFAKAVSSGFSDSLDCIYNIWPCAEPYTM